MRWSPNFIQKHGRPFAQALVVIAAIHSLTGCGGGSDTTLPPARSEARPLAPSSVLAGRIVMLDGSASLAANGVALAYRWTLQARPDVSDAALADADRALARLATDLHGACIVAQVVNDGLRESTVETVRIDARALQLAASAPSAAPQESGLVVQLLDAWVRDLGNGCTRYTVQWRQASAGPSNLHDGPLHLWFVNGAHLGFALSVPLPLTAGDAAGVVRRYEFEAPTDWMPLLWEHGTLPTATRPDTTALQWRFPAQEAS